MAILKDLLVNGSSRFVGKIYAGGGIEGDLTGNASTATKATQDGAGSTITSTYLKLSGGTMTGAITFASSQTWPTFNQSTTGNAATATKANNGIHYVTGTPGYSAWTSGKAYAVNDIIYYTDNFIYTCKTAHTSSSSIIPTNTTYWTKTATPVWGGTIDVSALFTGLVISYKIPCYGGTTSTQLNLTAADGTTKLGAKTILRNTGNTTTHLPKDSVVLLSYDGTYFRWADYDSNSNNYVVQTVTTANAEYPLLSKQNANNNTETTGSRFAAGVTLNPSTGKITAKSFKASTNGATEINAYSSTTTGGPKVLASTDNISVGIHVGTGGTNRGLYDFTSEKWLVYNDGTNVLLKGNADTATKATQDGSGNTITSTYLPLAGGTMTGNISYQGSKATTEIISFYNNTTDAYGNGIGIGGGGSTIIGGGEAKSTLATQFASDLAKGAEIMKIGNDESIEVYTNLQDGYSSSKVFNFEKTGNFHSEGISSGYQIIKPAKGYVSNNSSSVTGGILIPLYAWENVMITLEVTVFTYNSYSSFKAFIVGYCYQDKSWYNCSASIIGTRNNKAIYFGSYNNLPAIMIGDGSSVWAYPKVYVNNITIGHTLTNYSNWKNHDFTPLFITSGFTGDKRIYNTNPVPYDSLTINSSAYSYYKIGPVIDSDSGSSHCYLITSRAGESVIVTVGASDGAFGGSYCSATRLTNTYSKINGIGFLNNYLYIKLAAYSNYLTCTKVDGSSLLQDVIVTTESSSSNYDNSTKISIKDPTSGGTVVTGVSSVNGQTGAVSITPSSIGALSTSGGTLSGDLYLPNGKGIPEASSGQGYWQLGVSSDGTLQYLGAPIGTTYIRSSGDNLYHYRKDTGKTYKILDESMIWVE